MMNDYFLSRKQDEYWIVDYFIGISFDDHAPEQGQMWDYGWKPKLRSIIISRVLF